MNTTKIFNEYTKAINEIGQKIDHFPWDNKKAYAQWLAQCYFFVRHSTRLLGIASGVTPLGKDNLHLRMAKHISEEFAHDRLAIKDLEKLGFKISDFEELEETKIFYRNQYYGIQNFGPHYLMGYILFLEGLAVVKGPTIYKKVSEKFGKDSSVFVAVHAEEDIDHIDKAFEQVKDLSPNDEDLVLESLKTSTQIYKHMMYRLTQLAGQQVPTAVTTPTQSQVSGMV